MRSLLFEFAHESTKTRLLLEDVAAGRAVRLLLEGQMHALMAAILLRVAGPDALEGGAQPQPPDRRFREIAEAVWAGEG
jgi:hypothetical protein